MKYYDYLKQQFSFCPLKTGCLQCLAQIPVMAGERISVRMAAHVRLSPLRRSQVVEPSIELGAFFVPHRHIYSNWPDYLMEGVDENQTLATITATGGVDVDDNPYGVHFLGLSGGDFVLPGKPLHVLAGYNRIWNRFFRVPSDDGLTKGFGEIADNAIQGGALTHNNSRYGYRIAYPKTPWNTAIDDDVEAADYQLDTTPGHIDVRELEQKRARYGSEQARNFFNQAERYKDILRVLYGSSVNTDADERPTMLMHSEQYLGGHDIDGTDQATLGQFSGKGEGRILFGFPRRFFPEHGQIFILAWLRYPVLCFEERAPLNAKGNPDYKYAAGDAAIVSKEPPETLDIRDWLGGSANPSLGVVPYGQHYRTLPQARIHWDYQALSGFPFVRNFELTRSWRDLHYVNPALYDDIFQTTQLGHAQIESNIHVDAKSLIPPPLAGVFSGATR